jgi:hypothetical protein
MEFCKQVGMLQRDVISISRVDVSQVELGVISIGMVANLNGRKSGLVRKRV